MAPFLLGGCPIGMEEAAVDRERMLLFAHLREAADLYRQLAHARHGRDGTAERDEHLAGLASEYDQDAADADAAQRRDLAAVRRIEDELATVEQRLRDRRSRQDGRPGTVAALAAEISALRERRDQLEQQLLQAWQDVEQAAAGHEAHRQDAAAGRRRADRERADLADRADQAGRAAPRLETELEVVAARLPVRVARRLAQAARRHDDPIADLVEGACGSCGQHLPPQEAVDADREAALVTCQGCGRYVVARSSRRTRGTG
jgi:predicted  nucleic acid-binding Zn-ribbon protein